MELEERRRKLSSMHLIQKIVFGALLLVCMLVGVAADNNHNSQQKSHGALRGRRQLLSSAYYTTNAKVHAYSMDEGTLDSRINLVGQGKSIVNYRYVSQGFTEKNMLMPFPLRNTRVAE